MSPPVTATRELQAAVLSLKAMDRDLRNEINRMTRATFGPVWKDEVTQRATSRLHRAVLARGVRLAAGNPPAGIAASSTRRLRGGLVPYDDPWAFEVGSKNRDRIVTVTRRTRHGGHVTFRRPAGHQLAAYRRTGYVVLPAFKAFAPRLVSGWVQLIVRKTYDAIERRSA